MMRQVAAEAPATATYMTNWMDRTRDELAKVMRLPGGGEQEQAKSTSGKQNKRPDSSRIPPDIGGMSAVVQNTPSHRFFTSGCAGRCGAGGCSGGNVGDGQARIPQAKG